MRQIIGYPAGNGIPVDGVKNAQKETHYQERDFKRRTSDKPERFAGFGPDSRHARPKEPMRGVNEPFQKGWTSGTVPAR